jgi:hypothetical protein
MGQKWDNEGEMGIGNCKPLFLIVKVVESSTKTAQAERAIGIRAGDWSIEAMRDRVWRGESFSIIEKTIPLWGRPIIVNWSYAPIYDRRQRVIGFISEGFSRLPADESDIIDRLAAWLESAPPSDGRSTASFPLASS